MLLYIYKYILLNILYEFKYQYMWYIPVMLFVCIITMYIYKITCHGIPYAYDMLTLRLRLLTC